MLERKKFKITSQCSQIAGKVRLLNLTKDLAIIQGNKHVSVELPSGYRIEDPPRLDHAVCRQLALDQVLVLKIGRTTGLTTGVITSYGKPMSDEEWRTLGMLGENVDRRH